MVKSDDYRQFRRACSRVVAALDELEKLEANAEDGGPSKGVLGRLRGLGFSQGDMTQSMSEVASNQLRTERMVLISGAIEKVCERLQRAVGEVLSESKGLVKVPESISTELASKIVIDEIFGLQAFESWLVQCNEFQCNEFIADSETAAAIRVSMKAVAAFKGEAKPEDLKLDCEVDRYKSRLFCKLERWLVKAAEAEAQFSSTVSEKSVLIRLVMGALAQFMSEVKPEDLRLAMPYSKPPKVVMCPHCMEPYETRHEGAEPPLGVLNKPALVDTKPE